MSKLRQLTFGSLFAGIGGFDLGFEFAGLRCAWQVEIDPDCRRLLERSFPHAALFADIRETRAQDLTPVDVICGGFPCQDLSIAGKRAGLKGKRSGLFYELKRIINELSPRLVVWENVPGLFSADKGRDFARIIHALAHIGYFGAWRVLDAQYIGVAQRRRRVFGVFARGDSGAACASEILSLAEGLRGHPAPRRQAQESLAGTLESSIGRGRGAGTSPAAIVEVAGPLHSNAAGGRRTTDLEGHGAYIPVAAGTLNAGAHPGGFNGQDAHNDLLVAHTLCAAGFDASEDGTGRGIPLIADTVRPGFASADNINGHGLVAFPARLSGTQYAAAENLAPALQACNPTAVAFQPRVGRNGHGTPSDVAHALSAQAGQGDSAPCIASPVHGVRRLTPLECERLQGFPDNWTAGFSDSARYRMTGNAVPVPYTQWIGKRIKRFLKP